MNSGCPALQLGHWAPSGWLTDLTPIKSRARVKEENWDDNLKQTAKKTQEKSRSKKARFWTKDLKIVIGTVQYFVTRYAGGL